MCYVPGYVDKEHENKNKETGGGEKKKFSLCFPSGDVESHVYTCVSSISDLCVFLFMLLLRFCTLILTFLFFEVQFLRLELTTDEFSLS